MIKTRLAHQIRIHNYQLIKNQSSEKWMLFRCQTKNLWWHQNSILYTHII